MRGDAVTDYKKTDAYVMFQTEVPTDIGWAMAILHDDNTVTRTCKGCGVTSRDAIGPNRRVRAHFHHRASCPVMDRLNAFGGDGGSAAGQ